MTVLITPAPTLGPSESVDRVYLAEIDLLALQPVYISSDDSVSPAQANSPASYKCIGFALADTLAGNEVRVRQFGDLPGFTGLVANEKQFLSPDNAGEITTSVPVGAGNYIVRLGFARSSTDLFVNVDVISRRAV